MARIFHLASHIGFINRYLTGPANNPGCFVFLEKRTSVYNSGYPVIITSPILLRFLRRAISYFLPMSFIPQPWA
jgi:hypothetical protein